MKVGCHVSIAGGIFNAPANAAKLGCEVYQVFTRSPQGGPAPTLTDEVIAKFRAENEKYEFSTWAVHTPYFINFASTNNRIRHGSVSIVREELERSSFIGAKFLMTHLGSAKDVGEDVGHTMVCEGLAKMLDGYAGSTTFCIEIAAGAGAVLGDRFEEVGRMIWDVEKAIRKKNIIGVCFDTCHAFASGYDLRTPAAVKATLKEFDERIGLERLKLLHVNDSKFALGERRDRHEHIGQGHIGKAGFAALAKHPATKKLDWFLETEHDLVQKDIRVLQSLRGK